MGDTAYATLRELAEAPPAFVSHGRWGAVTVHLSDLGLLWALWGVGLLAGLGVVAGVAGLVWQRLHQRPSPSRDLLDYLDEHMVPSLIALLSVPDPIIGTDSEPIESKGTP